MIVVAGPPGSGKSTAFPTAQTGVDAFNIDDRAAELNQGSYRNIPRGIRSQAIKECEDFVSEHIRAKRSFAVETTLRSEITFRQAAAAKGNGFTLEMRYLCVEGFETNVERIANRADRGGHAATPGRIRDIREASLKNLPRAIREFDRVRAYDNSRWAEQPRVVMEARKGKLRYLAADVPVWFQDSLKGSEYECPHPSGDD
jgi:predicted ABC-type ATPase